MPSTRSRRQINPAGRMWTLPGTSPQSDNVSVMSLSAQMRFRSATSSLRGSHRGHNGRFSSSSSFSTSSSSSSTTSGSCCGRSGDKDSGSLLNQLVFFLLCDRLFCPRQRLTGLYSLFFYNVLSYMIVYLADLVADWTDSMYTPFVRISNQSNVRHLSMSATKIVLDLTRAVSCVISAIALILLFGLPDRNHFGPTWPQILLTLLYYVLTDKSCVELTSRAIYSLQLERFDTMESLWVPVVIRLATSITSGLVMVMVWLFTSGYSLLLVCLGFYVNVYQRLTDMDHYWRHLRTEKETVKPFRRATKEELLEYDDVCAICLAALQSARVTTCGHLFHTDCLRQVIKMGTTTCPICKKDLQS